MLTPKQRQNLSSYFNQQDFEDKDALAIYPFRYETRTIKDENSWQVGDEVIFSARIVSPISIFRRSYKQAIVRFEAQTDTHLYKIVSFNPYLKKDLEGQQVTIIGKVSKAHEINATSVNLKPIHEQTGIFPVYPLKGKLKQYQMRQIMKKVVKENIQSVTERVPAKFSERYRLLSTQESIKQLHQPSSLQHLNYALRTLKYAEFLDYQVALLLQKRLLKSEHKPLKTISDKKLNEKIESLPFQLTDDQLTSLQDIRNDLSSSLSMTRLLQGDVGSGKTIIALLASFIAVQNGFQVAYLCPTEVLMNQHASAFREFFNDSNISVLSSSLKTKEKQEVLDNLESGHTQIVVGTHSLFSESTEFNNLGLVIIDEQHRFGVNQRQALIQKGYKVDTLMMSATPIPRSLAAVLYAHLDVSTIETMPSSRKKVITKLVKQNSMIPIMDTIIERIKNKDQCYVVCPSIDQSTLKMRNVKDVYDQLVKHYGHQINIALIHGQLSSEEINNVLFEFKNQRIDLLVTTTVIEVGLHVPTANTMVIYDADRFGLAQIHQLRGRIGRDGTEGLCYLLTDSKDVDSIQRLQYLIETSDGFELAYYDLKMRGTGDLLGERQSGIPNFLLSDIIKDEKILVQAKEDAFELLKANDEESRQYVESIEQQMDQILLQAAI